MQNERQATYALGADGIDMALIIDGYNFLHAANIVAEGPGKYTLEKSRDSLLRFVASVVPKKDRSTTTVVFDGKDAPPGLDRVAGFAGMTVMFSEPRTEADDLIEELILASSAPRRLLVVSSDHRIQRAAARRQARSIDSEEWYWQQRPSPDAMDAISRRESSEDAAGPKTLSKEEVTAWLEEFGAVEVDEIERQLDEDQSRPRNSSPATGSDAAARAPQKEEAEAEEEIDEKPTDGFNPFPKGYGEDLLE